MLSAGPERERCSEGSRAWRCEFEWRYPEARSLGGAGRLAQASSSGGGAQRGESVAVSYAAETSSVAEPVVIHHGREERAQQSPRQSWLHAGRWRWRRLVLETSGGQTKRAQRSARRRMRPDLSQSGKPPADPAPSKPDLVELNRSSMTRQCRSRSRTKINLLTPWSLPNVPPLSCGRISKA